MKRRGLSLLELLMTISVFALAMVAVVHTFSAGLGFEQRFGNARRQREIAVQLEDKISGLLSGADIKDPASFFISPIPASTTNTQAPQASSNSQLGSSGSSSLVFTTWSEAPGTRIVTDTATDFETANSRYGPQGGTTEVGLSMTPVGAVGNKHGLFLREQRPADSDPTQGGNERLLVKDLQDIRFEFYDGANWQDTWDSRNGQSQKGKLPAAVRVTYLLAEDQTPHQMLIQLPLSGQTQQSSTANQQSTGGSPPTTGGAPQKPTGGPQPVPVGNTSSGPGGNP